MCAKVLTSMILSVALAACSNGPAPSLGWASGVDASSDGAHETMDDGGTGDGPSTDANPSPPQSRTIDFDDLASGVAVNTQYAGLAFSTSNGQLLQTGPFGSLCETSPGNTLQAGAPGVFNAPVTVDFSKPISNLKFRIGCIQSGGTIVKARLMMNGQAPVEVPVTPTGYAMWVDLSAYKQVTKLELYDVADEAGLAYDDFTFVQ